MTPFDFDVAIHRSPTGVRYLAVSRRAAAQFRALIEQRAIPYKTACRWEGEALCGPPDAEATATQKLTDLGLTVGDARPEPGAAQ